MRSKTQEKKSVRKRRSEEKIYSRKDLKFMALN